MITGENKTKFESYKNKLPKNSLCIIMQDAEDGMIDLMSYDTKEKMYSKDNITVLDFNNDK